MPRLVIMGEPIAQARPRFTKRGRPYSPQRAKKVAWIQNTQPSVEKFKIKPTTRPVSLNLIFTFSRPKSHYRGGRKNNPLKYTAPDEHIVKPDLSNLIKWVEDCLESIAWANDKTIVRIRARKEYTKGDSFTLIEYQELY